MMYREVYLIWVQPGPACTNSDAYCGTLLNVLCHWGACDSVAPQDRHPPQCSVLWSTEVTPVLRSRRGLLPEKGGKFGECNWFLASGQGMGIHPTILGEGTAPTEDSLLGCS